MGPKSTNACQYDQLCAGIKAGIDGAINWVQGIWDTKSTMEDWGFILVDAKNISTISIELEYFGQINIYGRPELVLFLTFTVTGHR